MKNFLNTLETKRAAAKEEGGFSLIDVVVTVAIIVALSVGGFIAYNGIVDNAKQASLDGAADQVYTAAIVSLNDASTTTNPDQVADDYERSSDGITITVAGSGDTLSVTAAKDGKSSVAGYKAPAGQ